MKQVNNHAEKIQALEASCNQLEAEIHEKLASLPNIPSPESKVSPDPKENVCIKEVGQKAAFSFPFKNHVELNEKLHLFDFKRGAKVSGSGWIVYKNLGARLEWALIQYMLNTQIKNGFIPHLVPHLVRRDTMYASGQLPKFEHQLFKLNDPDYPLYLIPTAEVTLNGLHYDEILEASELPLKYCAYSPCFRREAGAAGSSERGLIRTHQFNKVELFVFSKPEESEKMFQEMLLAAESVLQGLGLHYRNMLLVTGDMSFASTKTVDIEVYLPGQNRYYEVSSVSNCTDFQARRSKTKFRRSTKDKAEFVHTLNGSGLATSRLMVALLENNQQEDGSVIIPPVLRPYLDNMEKLTV
jgi:seryl-tRNA synthetase